MAKQRTSTLIEKVTLVFAGISAISIAGNFLVTWQNSSDIRKTSKRLDGLEFTVTDVRDLRSGLRKPLEGVWKYSMKYEKLWGEEGSWEAYGKAVFIWQPEEKSYLVMIGASLVAADGGANDAAQRGQFVTWLFEADLPTQSDTGWPNEPFDLECEYKGRTATDGALKTPGEAYARFTGLSVVRKNERLAFRMEGEYTASGDMSRGNLTLTRLQ